MTQIFKFMIFSLFIYHITSWSYICANSFTVLYSSPCGSETIRIYNTTVLRDTGIRHHQDCGLSDSDWIKFEHGEWGRLSKFGGCAERKPRDYWLPSPDLAKSLVFPVQKGFLFTLQNFGDRRPRDGIYKRCHRGTDIYTDWENFGGDIVSMTGGVVIGIHDFTVCYKGQSWTSLRGFNEWVVTVNIYNATLDLTFRYGEINKGSQAVKTGDIVHAGQYLGLATKCKMLHLEFWEGEGVIKGSSFPYLGVMDNGWLQFDYLGRSEEIMGKQRVCYDDPELFGILDDKGSKLLRGSLALNEIYFTSRSNCSSACYNHGICVSNSCECRPKWQGLNCDYHQDTILMYCIGIFFSFGSIVILILSIICIMYVGKVNNIKKSTSKNVQLQNKFYK